MWDPGRRARWARPPRRRRRERRDDPQAPMCGSGDELDADRRAAIARADRDDVGELADDPEPAPAAAERRGRVGAPHAGAVEARADVGHLHHEAPVGPGVHRDRRAAVLLRVGDHLVEREHEVAGALDEAAPHREVANGRPHLGDLRGIVTERRAVALLLHPCSLPPYGGYPFLRPRYSGDSSDRLGSREDAGSSGRRGRRGEVLRDDQRAVARPAGARDLTCVPKGCRLADAETFG